MSLLLLALFRHELSAFCDRFGNAASVAGLLVSLIGFALTLWTVYETQRASRAAQEKIREEVTAAQQETRETVAKIGLQLLHAESDSTLRLITEVRRASREQQWLRAAEKCQEAKQAAIHLTANPHLTPEEKRALREGADNLQLILEFIEKNRLGPSPAQGLAGNRMRLLVVYCSSIVG